VKENVILGNVLEDTITKVNVASPLYEAREKSAS